MKSTSQGCCVCAREPLTILRRSQKNKARLIPILNCLTEKLQESRVKPLHFGTAGEKPRALPGTDDSKYTCFGGGFGDISGLSSEQQRQQTSNKTIK